MKLPLNEILHGDCLEVLKTLPDESVTSIVTDPPYALGTKDPGPADLLAYLNGAELDTGGDFMGKDWQLPPVAVWKECFRVLKPGGYLLAFAGTRTQDLMSMGIRMAGFENRDTVAAHFGPSVLQWKYGSGFPKSHNVGAKIDKRLGLEREVIGTKRGVGGENLNDIVNGRDVRQTTDEGGKGVGAYGVGAKQVAVDVPVTAPASDEAKRWEGWGNNLKPAWEAIVCVRKPFSVDPLWCSIADITSVIEGVLWLTSPARFVEKVLESNLHAYVEAEPGFVRWFAVEQLLWSENQSDLMVTFQSPEVGLTRLSIVSSWSAILDTLWLKRSTFTTKMVCDMIIDLRTLRCSLSKSMDLNMLAHVTQNDGLWLSANTAKIPLIEGLGKLSDTQKPTAHGSVTEGLSTQLTKDLVLFARKYLSLTEAQLVNFVVESATTNNKKVNLSQSTHLEKVPSWEPIFMFRKPTKEKTLVDQVLATGTGAINIDGCRINPGESVPGGGNGKAPNGGRFGASETHGERPKVQPHVAGRWPANTLLVHGSECQVVGTKKVKAPVINRFDDGMKPFGDGAGHGFTSTQTGDENGEEEVPVYECQDGCPVKALDNQSGNCGGGSLVSTRPPSEGFEGKAFKIDERTTYGYKDSGGASRFFAQFEPDAPFFYCAKAGVSEKKIGKELEQHPTVKPVTLMSYLVRLVTPKGGVVLDPYSGSGTTCVAAVLEGVNFIGIEKHEPYVERARLRVEMARNGDFSKTKKTSKASKAKAPKAEKVVELTNEVNLLDIALTGE